MTDRERQLVRAEIAVIAAARHLESAIEAASKVRRDIAEAIDKDRRSLLWAAQELDWELAKELDAQPASPEKAADKH